MSEGNNGQVSNAERTRAWKNNLEARGGRKVNVILERPGCLALDRLLKRSEHSDKTVGQLVQEALVAYAKARRT